MAATAESTACGTAGLALDPRGDAVSPALLLSGVRPSARPSERVEWPLADTLRFRPLVFSSSISSLTLDEYLERPLLLPGSLGASPPELVFLLCLPLSPSPLPLLLPGESTCGISLLSLRLLLPWLRGLLPLWPRGLLLM